MIGKILVAYHDDFEIVRNEILEPIQTGQSLKYIDLGIMKDNKGDNISSENFKYSELSAVYYMWRNMEFDYYGLFHYRRLLNLNDEIEYKTFYDDYIVLESLNNDYEKYGLNKENVDKLMKQYDLVVPKVFFLGTETLYEHYKNAEGHYIEHLDEALKVLLEKYPEYSTVAYESMESHYGHFFDLFIMKKELFNHYCNWLFPILKKVDVKFKFEGKDWYESRYLGYIAERLFTIYLNYQLKHTDIKVKFTDKILLTNLEYHFKNFQSRISNCNLYLYGAGEYGEKATDILEKKGFKVTGFIDSDKRKVGKYIKGYYINSLEDVLKDKNAYILITSQYYEEIQRTIIQSNFNITKVENFIFNFWDGQLEVKFKFSLIIYNSHLKHTLEIKNIHV